MYLLLLFVVLPIVEISLLIQLGQMTSAGTAILVILVTGIIGGSLARHQGLSVYMAVQRDLQQGQVPTDHILSGLLVLVGGVLLVTPGILTDMVGLLLMIPGNRRFLGNHIKKHLKNRPSPNLHASINGMPFPGARPPHSDPGGVREVEAVDVTEDQAERDAS